jgi:hypothetical protein
MKILTLQKCTLVDTVETNEHIKYNLYIQKKVKMHITHID